MARVRALTAIVLLAVWIPATWQCLLEQARFFEPDDCCPASVPHDASSAEGGTVCCALASGKFKLDDGLAVDVTPEEYVVGVRPFGHCLRATRCASAESVFRLPWQVEQRAALPVRAPSFAS